MNFLAAKTLPNTPMRKTIRQDSIKKLSIILVWISAILLPLVCSAQASSEVEDELQKAITDQLACFPLELLKQDEGRPIIATKDVCLATIYHETGAKPLWINSRGPSARASIIKQYLQSSFKEGVNPQTYEAELIETLFPAKNPVELAHLDVLITYNLVKYIHDMSFGDMKYRRIDPLLFAEVGNELFNPVEAVKAALAAPDLSAYLDSLVPNHKYYLSLKESLQFYRQLANKNTWQPIPSGDLIHPGDQDERLGEIWQRLAILSGESSGNSSPPIYTPGFVEKVKNFQRHRGLQPDGVVGPKTLNWLNKTPQELIDIICINMARWRWQAHDLGQSHIIVNIAGFSLKAVSNNQTELEMPVIVGELQHETPVFSDQIRYLDFNPYWNVPPSIARNEELPALRKNSHYLADKHIRIFSDWRSDAVELDPLAIDWKKVSQAQMSQYKLRQDPGPWNALGRVKFVFPNHHSVYLHDTPTVDLFRRPTRAFSHGCIRVSHPLQLALFCLQNEKGDWSAEKIEQLTEERIRRIISLSSPLPVHITYQTVWFDRNGSIHFNDDIYGRDGRLMQILFKEESPQLQIFLGSDALEHENSAVGMDR